MKILFIGDIMGRTGRDALEKHLPSLKEKLKPDVIIVNGENAAHGVGITPKHCEEFYGWGADVITTGNHIWDQREIIPYIDRDEKLLRPINFPPGTPGSGAYIFEAGNHKKILVINAMARLFMESLEDPFRMINELLGHVQMGRDVDAIFVDFHGEATSEKMALAHYLDGRVSAVIGTHTHLPTADHHVLVGGTAFQSDAGMTGDFDSVIGVRKDLSIHRFVKKVPGERFVPADGEATLCGCFIQTNARGLATSIEPIRLGGRLSQAMPLG
jgi:metallophosphoesterase (TIGR00282 family)